MTTDAAKRLTLASAAAALTAACSPLSLFATLSPKDPGRLVAQAQAYGAGPRQRLDVYAPPGRPTHAPVAVFFYGGSWDSGRRQDYSWVGRALASRGFVAVVTDYRIYPEVRYPGFLEDGALAVRPPTPIASAAIPTASCSWGTRRAPTMP
jgi:acetyl esterase/lipase